MNVRAAMLLVVLAAAAHAAPKRRPAPAPAAASPPVAIAPAPVKAQPAVIDPATPVETLLETARGFFASLEYDRALPYTEAVLARGGTTVDQRADAWFLQASARAIVSDPLDAERPLRFLLRLKPDFELPTDTSPKLVAVFRKVQVEEKALATEAAAVDRARVKARMKISGGPPERARGGQPLDFRYQVVDPAGAVGAVRLSYRKGAEGGFSTLALARDAKGDWVASLPGEATASDVSLRLEYFAEASDAQGVLAAAGGIEAPLGLLVEPGTVKLAYKPVRRWVFGVSTVATVAAAVCAAVLGGLTLDTQHSLDNVTTMGQGDAALVQTLRTNGFRYAQLTNVLLIAAVALAILTVVLAPFVDWGT